MVTDQKESSSLIHYEELPSGCTLLPFHHGLLKSRKLQRIKD